MSAAQVRLTQAQLRAIERAAEAAYPEEACGLLVGQSAPDGSCRVSAVEASANVAAPPRTRRFEVDPKLRLRLERALRDGPDSVVGVYHSHPDGSAAPSTTDIAMIFEPAMVWLITAVDGDGDGDGGGGRAGTTTAWRPADDGTAFVPLGLDLGGAAPAP